MARPGFRRRAFACAFMLLLSATAHAQLFRAYLAPGGNDANPCTLAQPCRLLPAALAAVGSGGEIWLLESANYNSSQVDITKSVTILAVPGVVGSVVATGGTSAIAIATAGVKVTLRNLVIVPLPGGGSLHGIHMTAGTNLTVENCVIARLPATGILVNAVASVNITDTTIRGNATGVELVNGARATITRSTIGGNTASGVGVNGAAAGTTTTADIADSTMDGNTSGVSAFATNASAVVRISVHDSRVVRNSGTGVSAYAEMGADLAVSVSDNIISHNGTGIRMDTISPAKVWASGNTVSGNGTGFKNSGGLFESAGNNSVRDNTTANTDGTITPVVTK